MPGDVDKTRLGLLLDAVVAMAADLSLDSVLQRIVQTASELAGAQYAALGVLGTGDDRRLQAFVTHGLTEAQRQRIGDLPRGHGLLGVIIDRPEPLRLHDLAAHHASYGFPAHHPPMSSFLGVPVRIRDKVFGNLYLTEKSGGGDFTSEDESVVVALAAAAGVVIENARLYAEARRREQWLAATTEITQLVMGGGDATDALQVMADRVRELAGADVVTVAQRTSESAVEIRVMSGAAGELPIRLPVEGSLAGMVVVSGEPLVIEDIHNDPRTDADLAAVRASTDLGPIVMLPLRSPDEVSGCLGIGWRPANVEAFRDLDLEPALRFGEQVALAMEVARARADRERLSLLQERDRIGRDLHDLVIQRLFAIGLTLENTGRLVADETAVDRISRSVDEIDATIKDIRRSIFALSAPEGSTDLRAVIDRLVTRASEGLGFRPRVEIEGPVNSLAGTEVAGHFEAVLNETLSNAARHSRATRVVVRLEVGDSVTLVVHDNGIGLGSQGDHRGGLTNLRDRAEKLGGTFVVTSSEDGTHVQWQVPRVR